MRVALSPRRHLPSATREPALASLALFAFRRQLRCAIAAVALAALLGTIRRAQAASYSWNVLIGSFQNAANWTPAGGPPGTADTAQFNIASAFLATLDSDWTTAGFNDSLGTLNFALNGH